jgi:hypothetical protein
VPACHRKHNPIGGFHHVYCAVNNRSRDNCSDCFSTRFHRPSRRASFEADARRQAASLASLQAETTSASLMASPQNALLNLSAPAALPWSFNEWIRIWRWMNQSEKYRQNAAECYDSIRILSDPLDRAKMLARVQAWILLADQAERNSHPNLKTIPRPESPIK